MCSPVACEFLAQWRSLFEFLYFVSGIVLLAGVLFAYLAYRSSRQLAAYRNTIDKLASYRNSWDTHQIGRVRELVQNGFLAGPEYIKESLGPSDLEVVRFVLNEWEEIALCVKYKIYSEQILFEHYGRLGLELWKHLRPYMRYEQQFQASRWIEFDRLAVRWMIRTTSVDQEPALRELSKLSAEMDKVMARLVRP